MSARPTPRVRPHLPRPAAGLLALAAGLCLAPAADGTWSIVLIDTRTGEVALGSATCLTAFDLQAGTPVLLPLIGGATAQSFVDSSYQNRVLIRDRLLARVHPDDILDELDGFDSGHRTRQYGMGDTLGRVATFTGSGAGAWAGGATGQIGDIVYAVQGNVLTGAPVVDEAVAAIIATPGDLAAKMMAGMEAARLMGGDGRCSCSTTDPDGCGAPPPSFEKSAHIAYMLIARAGDTFGCNGSYRVGGTPFGIVAHDFDGDGDPDLAVANSGGSDVSLVTNTTAPGSPFPTFASLPTNFVIGRGPRGMLGHDVTGDGVLDLVAALGTDNALAVLPGVAGGGFGAPAALPVGGSPQNLALADFNGDGFLDAATANAVGDNVSVLLHDGAGAFGAAVHFAAGDGPNGIAAGNFDALPGIDLAVTLRNADQVVILSGDGAGGFAPAAAVPTGDQPYFALAADLEPDGDDDLVITIRNADQLLVFRNDGAGAFDIDAYPMDQPEPVTAADVDADGTLDLLVYNGAGQDLTLLRGNGDGTFAPQETFHVPSGANALVTADLDADGWLDVAATPRGFGSAYIVQGVGDGRFNDGLGCATGDYYMEFNIPFADSSDPDPVFTLQEMYDAWRAALAGRPDAVRSVVSFDPARLIADGASTATMTIRFLDLEGDPISVPLAGVTVEHAGTSDGICSIGAVTQNPDGTYAVTLTAGTDPGTDAFLVTADDGIRPVVLMPPPTIDLTVNPDFNGDGFVSSLDVIDFLIAWNAHDPRADLNGDGLFDSQDVLLMLDAFGA